VLNRQGSKDNLLKTKSKKKKKKSENETWQADEMNSKVSKNKIVNGAPKRQKACKEKKPSNKSPMNQKNGPKAKGLKETKHLSMTEVKKNTSKNKGSGEKVMEMKKV